MIRTLIAYAPVAAAIVAGKASKWPVSSTANSAPVSGARMAPLIMPLMPIIAQKPIDPGRK